MTASTALEGKPLYVQVRDILRERIRAGQLKPGSALPNEFEIARELGVSQGTVRKALDALTADKLLVRHQGRGTFVREQTPADVLFRFFQVYDRNGVQIRPDSCNVRVKTGRARPAERARLGIDASAVVARIERLRTRQDQPFIAETIIVPLALFPGLDEFDPLPNTLYDLFQRAYGVTVARAEERITPVAADADRSARLGLALGTPLLRIDRTTFALDDRPVEWRVSDCHLAGGYYLAKLG